MICTYNVRIDAWDRNTYFDKKRKQHQSPADDASTAETATGRVRRGEQGEAWRANSRPNVGSHLELGRLRLKTWSKSDVTIAQTTGQNICTCVYIRTCAAAHEQESVVLLYCYASGPLLAAACATCIPPRGLRAHGSQEASFTVAKSSS